MTPTDELRAFGRLVVEERRVRAAGSVVGRWWGLLLPLFEAGVFTLLFGFLWAFRRTPADYLLFALLGLLVWRVLARGIQGAAASLRRRRVLLTGWPVPARTVAAAAVADAFVAGALGLPAVAVALWLWAPAPEPLAVVVWLPVGVGLHVATALGGGLIAAVAAAFYRDAGRALGPLLGGLMFLAPVVYPSRIVPEGLRGVFLANPAAAAVEAYRAALIGDAGVPPGSLVAALAIALALVGVGLWAAGRWDARLREVL